MKSKSWIKNFFETKLGFFIFPITLILSYIFRFNYNVLGDYKFLFSNIIAIVSIALGFLTTIVFQLLSLSNSNIMDIFRQLNLLKKLYFYEKSSIISCSITIILSIVIPLYFDLNTPKYTIVLTACYNALLIYSIYSILRFSLIFKSVNNYANNENIKNNENNEYIEATLPNTNNHSNSKID